MQESPFVLDWIQHGLDKGQVIGMEKGAFIGQIQLYQRLLHEPITEKAVLEKRPMEELRSQLQELEQRFLPQQNGTAS